MKLSTIYLIVLVLSVNISIAPLDERSRVQATVEGSEKTQQTECTSDTCVDERTGCDGDIFTFSCASAICNKSPETECYICVQDDNPDENEN